MSSLCSLCALSRASVVPLCVCATLLVFAGPPRARAGGTDDAPLSVRICHGFLRALAQHRGNGGALDANEAQAAVEAFMTALDPEKMYFLAADEEEFSRRAPRCGDDLASGEPVLARLVHARLCERLRARDAAARLILAAGPDLADDETFAPDRSRAARPATEVEAFEVLRLRLELAVLEQIARGRTFDEACARVRDAQKARTERIYALADEKLLALFLDSVAASGDPHGAYLSPREIAEFEVGLGLELEGIGAMLRVEDGDVVIEKLVPGGPAERDGRLRPRDRILGVAPAAQKEAVAVRGLELADVVGLIRGPAGSELRLEIARPGSALPLDFTLERGPVRLADQSVRGRLREETLAAGGVIRLGWLDVPSFYHGVRGAKLTASSALDIEASLAEFRSLAADLVVLDLRRNAGGVLEEAVAAAGLFLAGGAVVQVLDTAGNVRVLDDPDGVGVAWDGPLVVLVSGATASAAEVVAAALRDHRRAVLVGDGPTFGKGTVQQIFPLGTAGESELGALKLTVARFHGPRGDAVEGRGVAPDIVLAPSGRAAVSALRSGGTTGGQIASALPAREDGLSPATVAEIAARAAARIAADPTGISSEVSPRIIDVVDDGERIPLERARYLAWHTARENRLENPAGGDGALAGALARIAADLLPLAPYARGGAR